jgi:light-regulated signal transduction histidine kinase (bacteriophytochrome)
MAVPLDLSYSYLRAMAPVHLEYLKNMDVVSLISISLEDLSQDRLWGLICCHSYGDVLPTVSFHNRQLCYTIGVTASIYLSNLLNASRLNAGRIIKSMKPDQTPTACITASPCELLHLFDADFGFLVINGEAQAIGKMASYKESITLLHYLRLKQSPDILSTDSIRTDFSDLKHEFEVIAGVLYIPLSITNLDFIIFLRRDQAKTVNWAGKPLINQKTGSLEPRNGFAKWTERVHGTSVAWTAEQCTYHVQF